MCECYYSKERDEIFEILKDFKCLDKIRDKIKDLYNKVSHIPEITTKISNTKEFIYYGDIKHM